MPLALFGAFVNRAAVTTVDVLTPKVFIGLLVGAMLPYWFSAMTMKSVVSDALKMVEEVCRQFNTIPGLMEGTAKPDYATCVKISIDASIKEMIPPGALVMLTPPIVGIFFGVETLSGVLAGSLVSGVQVIFWFGVHILLHAQYSSNRLFYFGSINNLLDSPFYWRHFSSP
ncbi:hypothetical protein Ahy_B06g084054 [Arachis hypogaea]|uniref:H(+)-exporting diphosphatase n=1 Tax=Arachis hypogaea TaxID=3818 RepID=A0A444YR24_ARAHY|nr:hypothetical protein Ahy_B06g084054 [Arachis hypogaea]